MLNTLWKALELDVDRIRGFFSVYVSSRDVSNLEERWDALCSGGGAFLRGDLLVLLLSSISARAMTG